MYPSAAFAEVSAHANLPILAVVVGVEVAEEVGDVLVVGVVVSELVPVVVAVLVAEVVVVAVVVGEEVAVVDVVGLVVPVVEVVPVVVPVVVGVVRSHSPKSPDSYATVAAFNAAAVTAHQSADMMYPP
jgi:hypothetical protein